MRTVILSLIAMSLILVNESGHCSPKKSRRFNVISVNGTGGLNKLKLKGSNETATSYINTMTSELSYASSDHTFRFLFQRTAKTLLPSSYIYQEGKGILKGFLRTPNSDRIGSSWESLSDLSASRYGLSSMWLFDISTATKGICGPIAVLHSLVRLGLRSADDITDGNFLNQQQLSQVLKYQTDLSGIKIPNYKQAHIDAGATECEESDIINAESTAKLSAFNDQLAAKMSSKDPVWDCGFVIKTVTPTGAVTLHHIEHVVGVESSKTKRGHTQAVIKTVNGLDQGDKGSSIPASPGTNSWKSVPRGDPNVKFQSSTSANDKLYKSGLPAAATHVQWVCCR